ncbi:MAG: response regulator [Proteobacteria bacterium]|nr:response regulator [Pseudomonadota bacterium]
METKFKIMAVEDEPSTQVFLQEILEDEYELLIASSGEEALRVVDGFKPDIVLLDIMMPGIDGYEVCRRIRTQHGLTKVKIVFLSAKTMARDLSKGYEVGADDYLVKPFEHRELLDKIRDWIHSVKEERKRSVKLDKLLK